MGKPNIRQISGRLTLSFTLLVLILLFFGFYSLYGINNLSGLTLTIYNHPLVVSNAALQANVSVAKMHRNMKDVVLFASSDRIQQSIAEVEQQEQQVYRNLDMIRLNILGDKGKKLEADTRTLFANWRPIRQEVIDLVHQGQREEGAEITVGKGARHVAALEEKMGSLTKYARSKADSFIIETEAITSRSKLFSILYLLLAISVSSLVAFFTIKHTSATEREIRKSRQLLENAIDYAPIGMVLVEPGGMFHRVNDAFSEMIGYAPDELSRMSFQKITHQDDQAIGLETVKQLLAGEIDKAILEKRYIKKDGSVINVYLTTTLLRDPQGTPLYFFTQVQDITERKLADENLRKAKGILQAAMDSSHAGIAIADAPDGTLRYVNDAGLFIRGGDRDSAVKGIGVDQYVNSWKILDLDGRPLRTDEVPLARAVMLGEKCSREFIIRRSQGDDRIVWANAAPVRDEQDNVIAGVVVFLDITERKRAEVHVQHLNMVLRSIRDINQLIVRERDPENLIREGCRLLVENRSYSSALIVLTDESDRITSWAASGIASNSNELNAMLERQELPPCHDICQSAREAIIIDSRSSICSTCPIFPECKATPSLCIRLMHNDTNFGYIVVTLDTDLNVDDEERSLFTEMAGDLAYALNFFRMETDHARSESKREMLKKQLLQSQKLESVGRLAGGVAHDYNNMLSIIIGYAEMAIEKLDKGDPLQDDIAEILDAANRSADITRQLLAFSRQQTTAPKMLDLNDNIENMLKMLRRLIGEDIDLAWKPAADMWPVKIDPTQLDQVLANLCVNARDAIKGVGHVTIETQNVSFDEDYCADHAEFIPGDYVLLAVSDDGCGMTPETINKIFEPFFSTKGRRQGTGLGLSTVYGIVRQNNGFINVYSEPEKGTTFKLYLPRHEGQPVEPVRDSTSVTPLSRGETVLLVEDDTSILKLGERMLNRLGYAVLTAGTPSEAISLFEEHNDRIDLLITDVVMPVMNGRELSQKLQAMRPGLKTLFMSGYTSDVIAHRGVLEEGIFFIPKPLSKKELAVKIREILDTNNGSAT